MAALRVCSIALFVMAACVEPEPDLDLGEATQASSAPSGQGNAYQGNAYQGNAYQGNAYQGNAYQGASLGGIALTDGSVQGTALVVWKLAVVNGVWRYEQRFPNKVCVWSLDKAINYGCTFIAGSAPSPLYGAQFPATFLIDNQNVTVTVKIAQTSTSTSTRGVTPDLDEKAMHPLIGSASSSCSIIYPNPTANYPHSTNGCDNPNGCRVNCDLWLYDLKMVNAAGEEFDYCQGGAKAIALAGTYDQTGRFTSSNTKFTFACTGGTIAKCTRWGYRGWSSARKFCAASNCGTDTTLHSMRDSHQSCVRAAMADYCSNGNSFTKNGTLVDIWDYQKYAFGFVPRTGGTAFLFESIFDKDGANQIDHLRYQEAGVQLDDEERGCAGRFEPGDGGDVTPTWVRTAPTWGTGAVVQVDSGTACAHSERTVGKWLHPECTNCTSAIGHWCTDPADPRGWNADCVAQVASKCSTSSKLPMTSHSECTAGVALDKLSTGCTVRVCNDRPSCCSLNGSWNATCVADAHAKCTGGQERWINRFTYQGFCGGALSAPPPRNTL